MWILYGLNVLFSCVWSGKSPEEGNEEKQTARKFPAIEIKTVHSGSQSVNKSVKGFLVFLHFIEVELLAFLRATWHEAKNT